MDRYVLNPETRRRVLEVLDSPSGDRVGDAVAILHDEGLVDLAADLQADEVEFRARLRRLAEERPSAE